MGDPQEKPSASRTSLVSHVTQARHTCDKFQKGIREIFLSFQGGLSKTYRIYRKILNSHEGDFKILVKSVYFRRNFRAHFRSGRVHMYGARLEPTAVR